MTLWSGCPRGGRDHWSRVLFILIVHVTFCLRFGRSLETSHLLKSSKRPGHLQSALQLCALLQV